MKEIKFKSYNDLPMHLTAEMVAQVLGISISNAYKLMRDKNFPSMRIGKRYIVPKDHLRKWIDEQVTKRGNKNAF